MDDNTTYPTDSSNYSEGIYKYIGNFDLFLSVLSIAGIACNSLCLFVFSRYRSTRNTTRFLLQMLTVADLIYLLVHIASVFLFTSDRRRTLDLVKVVTIWLVAVIAIDRYLIVCRPQLAAKYSTLPRVKLAVFVVWIATIVLILPLYFDSVKLLAPDVFIIGYRMCFITIVGYVLPLSVIVFSTVLLMKSRLQSKRSGPAKISDRDEEVTAAGDHDSLFISTSSVVIIVFTVTHILCTVLMLVEQVKWYKPQYGKTARIDPTVFDALLSTILKTLLVSVASFKLAIYSSSNSIFQQILRGCCHCTRQASTVVDDKVSPYNDSYQGDAITVSNNPENDEKKRTYICEETKNV